MDVQTICRGLMASSRRLSAWPSKPRGINRYVAILSCDEVQEREVANQELELEHSHRYSKMTNDLEMIAELQTSNIDIAIADSNQTPTADNNASIDSVSKDFIPLLNLPIEKGNIGNKEEFVLTPLQPRKKQLKSSQRERVVKMSPLVAATPDLNSSKLSKDSKTTSSKHGTSIYEQILADIRFTKRSNQKSTDRRKRESPKPKVRKIFLAQPSPKKPKKTDLNSSAQNKHLNEESFSPARFNTPTKEEGRLTGTSLQLSNGLRSRHIFASGKDQCRIYDSESDVRPSVSVVRKISRKQQLSTERIRLYRYKPRIERSYSNLYKDRLSRSVSHL